MNFKNLQDDFKTRYNTNANVPCVFSCTPLFLLGDITCSCGGHSLLTGLSAGTALAINTHIQKNIFSIQTSGENTMFTCTSDELSKYHENNFAKQLFHILSRLISHISPELSGADMLFEHNTAAAEFQNPSGALISAAALLFAPEKKPLDIISAAALCEYTKMDLVKLIVSLTSEQGHCVLTDSNSMSYQRYKLPAEGKKFIIITTDIKKHPVSLYMQNAYKELKKNIPELLYPSQITKDMLNSNSSLKESDVKLLCFMLNEENRIEKYPHISGFDDICRMINESGREMVEIINDSVLSLLFEILSKSAALAYRPTANASGAYCIVCDEKVDDFIKETTSEYEKKAGYKPAFYICDTAASGI